jgi:hypothetical protein
VKLQEGVNKQAIRNMRDQATLASGVEEVERAYSDIA